MQGEKVSRGFFTVSDMVSFAPGYGGHTLFRHLAGVEGKPADLSISNLPFVSQNSVEFSFGQARGQSANHDFLALLGRF